MNKDQLEKELVVNKLITPDGTVLESKHRHDYRSYVDTTTNEVYSVDGGLDYVRGSINKVQGERILLNATCSIEDIRVHFTWGTYGKEGNNKLSFIKLKEMSDAHIIAIINDYYVYGFNYVLKIIYIFMRELAYRQKMGYSVKDK